MQTTTNTTLEIPFPTAAVLADQWIESIAREQPQPLDQAQKASFVEAMSQAMSLIMGYHNNREPGDKPVEAFIRVARDLLSKDVDEFSLRTTGCVAAAFEWLDGAGKTHLFQPHPIDAVSSLPLPLRRSPG